MFKGSCDTHLDVAVNELLAQNAVFTLVKSEHFVRRHPHGQGGCVERANAPIYEKDSALDPQRVRLVGVR